MLHAHLNRFFESVEHARAFPVVAAFRVTLDGLVQIVGCAFVSVESVRAAQTQTAFKENARENTVFQHRTGHGTDVTAARMASQK